MDGNIPSSDVIGGAVSFKLKSGDIIFISQAEQYQHRGLQFQHYSLMEYSRIVEIKAKKTRNTLLSNKGRPPRDSFALRSSNPLFRDFVAIIRAKMCTPIFGGPPPPSFPGNIPDEEKRRLTWQRDITCFAKYIIDTFVPWDFDGKSQFSRDPDGLASLLDLWDRRSSSLINRQRLRYIINIMNSRHRSSRNEGIASDWRDRNTDYWIDMASKKHGAQLDLDQFCADGEGSGQLCPSELHDLTASVTDIDVNKRVAHDT